MSRRRPEQIDMDFRLDSRTAPKSRQSSGYQKPSASCRRSVTYPSAFAPARFLGSSGRTVPASRRSCACSKACTYQTGASFRSMAFPSTLREPEEAHTAGIRVIHQEPDIVPELTVAENIFIGAMPRRLGVLLDWRRLEEQTRTVLSRFGMDEGLRARDLCARLGPAQRQMIEIMRAVRAGGRLIAFDEPTSSLTDEEARHLFRIIRQLKSEGTSIVYISHRLNEIIDLADRVAVLRDGRLVADQPVAGLTERAISQLMIGRELKDLFRRQKLIKHDAILKVSGLSSQAVHDIHLTLHRGEVLGIGGLMGAGRSELARAIVGFDKRIAGEVVVEGRPLRPNDVAASIAAGIGLAPEDRKTEALLLMRSILDNATLCVPEQISTAGLFDRRKALAVVGPLIKNCPSAPPASISSSRSFRAATSRRSC